MEEEINWNEFKNKLIELNGKIETIEEISRHKGDKFNLFSILGIQKREVETHSFLLYDLINPKGSHYQGDLYLRIFLEEILRKRDEDREKIEDFPKDVFKIDDILDDVKVGIETFISGKSIKNGRIDFTISNSNYYIAIEMKIDSKENDKQLDNYRDFLNEIKNKKTDLKTELYYLTLFGDKADKSEIKEEEYVKISFLEHISNFIEKSIEKSATLPIIRESLIQYKTTIKNITNQTTGEFSEMIEKLMKEPKIVKAATILSKELPELWAKRELYFWEELEKKLKDYLKSNNLEKNGWEISFYDEEIKSDKLSYIIKTNVKNIYITKNDFYFRALTQKNGNFFYEIESDNKKIDIDKINNKLKFEEKVEDVKWQFTKIENGLNFSKDYANPTYDVFDDKLLDEIVEKIYEEIVYYMDKIIKSKLV